MAGLSAVYRQLFYHCINVHIYRATSRLSVVLRIKFKFNVFFKISAYNIG